MTRLRDACGGGRGSYPLRGRAWPGVRGRTRHCPGARGGDEGDVVGGDVVAVVGGDAVVVVAAAVDDHDAEGSGWKAGWDPETFGLEKWACLNDRAFRPWANLPGWESWTLKVARLAYVVGPRPRFPGLSLAFCIWTVYFETRFSPENAKKIILVFSP